MTITTEEAIDLARRHASNHGLSQGNVHTYLPRTIAETQAFEPHAWVVDAIRDATSNAETQRAIEFRQGICVALQVIAGFDQPVIWAELVTTAGAAAMLRHAAHVEPAEWELAGFQQYARSELRRLKPRRPK